MSPSCLRALACAFALVAARTALALDPPHDASSSPAVGCDTCHIGHNAAGAAITSVNGNPNLCLSCHNTYTPWFGTWVTDDQAVPGASGKSHRWDSSGVSARHGAKLPLNADMAKRMPGGLLQCSTCHDVHNGGTLHRTGAKQHVSTIVHTGGSGTLTASVTAAGLPRGYLIEMVTSTTFRLSNDGGRSWFGYSGSWVTYTGSNARTAGASVGLNDAAVTVSFSGTLTAGERWSFQVTYPMLRMDIDQSQMCEDCHRDYLQAGVHEVGAGDGTKVFSHPSGPNVSLAKSFDRATILDANGLPQTASGASADGLSTNDIRLDSTGKVRCLSCHSPHNADSNSLTEDVR